MTGTIIKKILKIIWLTFVAVTATVLAAILAIQLPRVQTFIADKVTEKLEKSLDGNLEFDKIHLKPFNAMVIKNISIIDKNPVTDGADTLFRAEYVIARFSLNGLFGKKGIRIGRAYISNAEMTLVVEEDRVNLTRIFRIPMPDPEKPKKDDPVFHIRRASVYDMTFRMKNTKHEIPRHTGHGIDWDDMEASDINIEARQIDLTGRIMTGVLDFMSFREKSGYICNSLSGKAKVGNGQALIEELRISDPWSELYLPMYSMRYDSPRDFSDYIGKIRMDGIVKNSFLDTKTLAFFAPGLEKANLKTNLSGTVSGTVDDLNLSGMSIATPDSLCLEFDGSIAGLPEIRESDITLDLHRLRGTSEALEAAIKAFSPDMKLDISHLARGAELRMHGHVSGSPEAMNLDMAASLGSGYLKTVLDIRNLISADKSVTMEGNVTTRDFDIGKILDSGLLRQCTLRTGFKADLGNRDDGLSLDIDSLFIDRLNLNGYDYSNIAAAGILEEHSFDGRIICNDPNLNFLFQGVFSLSPRTRNSVYKFYANLGYADLHALNLDNRGISKAALQASANFNRLRNGELLGSMDITDIVLENSAGKYDIGDIDIDSYFGDEMYRMRMSSPFADMSFAGTAQILHFVRDLKDITLKRELPALFRDSTTVEHKNRYRISYRGKDSMDLLAFLSPGLYISDSTSLVMTVDTLGVFRADLESPRLAYNENYIKDVKMRLDNLNGSLSGEINGKSINVATLILENNAFKLFAKDNFIGFGYTYENPGELINRGEVFITADVGREEDETVSYDVRMLPSRLLLNSREWSINPSSLNIRGKDINVGKVEFTSGDQSVKLSGGYSDTLGDTLTLRLERFDISVLNPLLKNRFGIQGAVTGEASIISPRKERGLELDFLVDSTRIAGADAGTLMIHSEWDKSLGKLDATVANELDGTRNLGINGSYFPSEKRIKAAASLSGLDISYAGPFLKSVFSDMSGHISGDIKAEGPVDALLISSENARIDDSELRIAFTNVPYNATGGFHLDRYGVHFDDIVLQDRFGNTGRISGGIRYDRLKDMELDTRISITDMECLNTTEKDNSSFYGNLSASGNLSITGPFNAIRMDINARTSGDGQLHIPIPSSATAITGNLLTFKQEKKDEYVDPYELMVKKIKTDKKTAGDFGVRLNVEATPETEAFIEIDKASGNVLRGRGAGNIELQVRRGDFSILGDYTLTGGSYRFVAQGLAYRDFTIEDGSSIKFNGDIMDSDLDIQANYRTKTSLSTLIADTSSVSTRRTVDCGINISDKIRNPRLAFSIDIPDIDPTVKSRVESALSTEDKVQKQFLSLIMFNSFLPDDQSGIVNNASMLYSNVMSIMYNQLNNIFQKLEIPLDLGLNYQPNERGEDIFDVAISTQLFNNRVVVNGNFGNRRYSSGTSNSDVVGDLDIEIKLDRPGFFRLNLFSHSADQYTNYLDDSQRNGIGLAYQQEFNTFREFFSNLFSGRKRRKAHTDVPADADRKKKVIIVTADDNDR